MNNEFFDFHEKVNTILEEQDEILAMHMAAIKVLNSSDLGILTIGRCQIIDLGERINPKYPERRNCGLRR